MQVTLIQLITATARTSENTQSSSLSFPLSLSLAPLTTRHFQYHDLRLKFFWWLTIFSLWKKKNCCVDMLVVSGQGRMFPVNQSPLSSREMWLFKQSCANKNVCWSYSQELSSSLLNSDLSCSVNMLHRLLKVTLENYTLPFPLCVRFHIADCNRSLGGH